MNRKELMKKHGITPEQLTCQFYGVQHRRWPVCGTEVELGMQTAYDKTSGMIFCRKCSLLLANVRHNWGSRLEWVLTMVRNEHAGSNDNK